MSYNLGEGLQSNHPSTKYTKMEQKEFWLTIPLLTYLAVAIDVEAFENGLQRINNIEDKLQYIVTNDAPKGVDEFYP